MLLLFGCVAFAVVDKISATIVQTLGINMTRAKGDIHFSKLLYNSMAVEVMVKPLRGSPLQGASFFLSLA